VIPTFLDAFPDFDWQELEDAADDPRTVSIALVPPVTAIVSRPFPDEAEARVVPAEVLTALLEQLEGHHADELPAGVSKRRVSVPFTPLLVISLRRSVDPGVALGRMVECGFLSEEAGSLLADAVRAGENILVAGPSSSAKTSLLYACVGEVGPERRVVVVEEPEPKAHVLLPLPPNVERIDPHTRFGLAHLLREELSSADPPDVMVLGEVSNWAVSLAVKAVIEERWSLMAAIRARDVQSAIGRLVTSVAEDQLRRRQERAEVEEEVARALDLIGVMERHGGDAWLARLVRPVSPTEWETLVRSRQRPQPVPG
jgi:Flp pilus assembly CpaF family ATPase